MCGIYGTVGVRNQALMERMGTATFHRGPDDGGVFLDGGVSLGVRRLKIIDLEGGHQPIHNETKMIWLVFNGEIYNFQELRYRLEAKEHKFYTKTDCEAIVHLYEEYGEDCIRHLRGMFAFAIWDKLSQKLFLARDRIGIKPLYYTFSNGALYFASELKALLEDGVVKREINYEAIHNFLTFLYIPAPLTIFNSVFKLPAGHILKFQDGTHSIEKYWDLELNVNKEKDEFFYLDKIYDLLQETVKSHLISDVPLGVFLSGGVDSSILVSLMASLTNQPIKTFTIGYGKEDSDFNELSYARLVSECFGTEHKEFIVKPNAIELLPKLAWHFDEPFADSSCIPTFLISQLAREDITVALSGIGGDEAFGGYPRYSGAYVSNYYQHVPNFLKKAAVKATTLFPERPQSRDIFSWAKRFASGGLLPFEKRYLEWVTFLQSDEVKKLYSSDFIKNLKDASPIKQYFSYFKDGKSLEKIFYIDIKTYLTDDLLFMADKMSMANSLELRVPYCDHKVMEFTASIPYGLKLKGFKLKHLLKKAFEDLLPQEITKRRKHGFMIPIGRWIKQDLRGVVEELLSRQQIEKRGYFNYEYIRWILNQHYSGKRNFTDRIWALMNLEMWHRIYMDGDIKQSSKTKGHYRKNIPTLAYETQKQSVELKDVKKILIVNLAGIGDAVMSVPALKALREKFSNSYIALLTNLRSFEIINGIPYVDEIFTLDIDKIKYFDIFRLLKKLRNLKFDMSINLYEVSRPLGAIKMATLFWFVGARYRVGRDTDGFGFFFNYKVPEKSNQKRHTVELFLDIPRFLGWKGKEVRLEIPIGNGDINFARDFLMKKGILEGDLVVGLHTGAKEIIKCWPNNNWEILEEKLKTVFGAKVIITGKGEDGFNTKQFAALARRFNLFITNDTGSMHIAAAIGVPIVALFGPSDPHKCRPYTDGNKFIIVRKQVNCRRPCYKFNCRDNKCMKSIEVDDVFLAVDNLLNRQDKMDLADRCAKSLNT